MAHSSLERMASDQKKGALLKTDGMFRLNFFTIAQKSYFVIIYSVEADKFVSLS